MALIKCSECEREISSKATTCPGCGNPMNQTNKSFEIPPKQKAYYESWIHWDSVSKTAYAAGERVGKMTIPQEGRKGKCLYCGKMVWAWKEEPIKCPSCQNPLLLVGRNLYKYYDPAGKTSDVAVKSNSPTAAPDPNQNPVVLISFFFVIIMVGGLLFFFREGEHPAMTAAKEEEQKAKSDPLATRASVFAEDRVKKMLKAPSTAKFERFSRDQVSGSNGTYTVRSYVDAQNSYGAMLRNHYTCQVVFESSSTASVTCQLSE